MTSIFRIIDFTLALIFLFISHTSQSQGGYQYGILPSLNLSKSISDDWALNFKTESRQQFKTGVFGEASNDNYDYLLTDLSLLGAHQFKNKKIITFGYLIRIKGDEIINRGIQQLIIKKQHTSFITKHRFTTDQTFFRDEASVFRLRYRLSVEFTIGNPSSESKYFYFTINNEYLNSLKGNVYDFEIRGIPIFGYKYTDKSKLECGLDYRINSFISGTSFSKLWLVINWYSRI